MVRMRILSKERHGELFAFSSAFLSGFFPIVIVLSYTSVSGIAALAWSTLFASGFFAAVLTHRHKWRELKNALLWKYGFFIAFFIGILFFGLYFWGLQYTTPGNVSIIVLFQVFTSFLFFNVYRRESISHEYILGSILMVLGACIVLAPSFGGVNIGDVVVLAATLFPPIGNYFQQKARRIASAESVLFIRNILSVPFFFFTIYALDILPSAADLRTALPFLVLLGVVFLGFEKILWIEGIHRISVTKAAALVSLVPFFTLLFAWIILGQVPTIWQLSALAPLVAGVLLLTDQLQFRGRYG